MSYRPAVVVAVLLAAPAPADGEATTRMSFSIAKSFHPESDRNYSTVHPGFGATGRLVGEWLRWRAGLVWHSHSRFGPYTGVAATWQVLGNWRLGLSAGIVGNYPRGRWVRRGVVPIAQWKDRDRNLAWEFGFARAERVTFVGLSVQIPLINGTLKPNATGKPGITGFPQAGESLTATIGDITDADGLPAFPSGFTFQWVRVPWTTTDGERPAPRVD